jgi:hypothetical protein
MWILAAVVMMSMTLSPEESATLQRLRGASARERHLIGELQRRSATARALMEEIETSDVIVYVQLTTGEPAGRALTVFVVATERHRFLRVSIGARTPAHELPPLLAHELQHVVEIARAVNVRDTGSLRKHYARIGDALEADRKYDTAAAREIFRRVRRETLASRKLQNP